MTLPLTSSTRVLVDASVLRRRAAAVAGGMLADLRGDAYGHGVLEAARILSAVGVPEVLVDPDQVDGLRGAGIRARRDGVPDVDASALYGIPSAPAMTLRGQVMSTKRLLPGDAVSYGYTYRAERESTVALVTGGYAQGIVRALSNRALVEVGGVLCPIVGRVAMDVCVVDVSAVDPVVGDEVVYFGGTGPARDQLENWVRVSGLTAGELVTIVGLKGDREWTE